MFIQSKSVMSISLSRLEGLAGALLPGNIGLNILAARGAVFLPNGAGAAGLAGAGAATGVAAAGTIAGVLVAGTPVGVVAAGAPVGVAAAGGVLLAPIFVSPPSSLLELELDELDGGFAPVEVPNHKREALNLA